MSPGPRMRGPAGPNMFGPGLAHMCASQSDYLPLRMAAQRCILATSPPADWMHCV